MITLVNYLGGKLIIMPLKLSIIKKTYKSKLIKIEETLTNCLENSVDIPESLIKIIVYAEDKRYFKHLGIDFYAISRALKNNIFKIRKEGASTIPQQLVRIILNEREIKISRKIQEIFLSVAISSKFSKEQIILGYCQLYLFDNCIGLTNLCLKENCDIKNLTFIEQCQIAARFKYPILRNGNYSRYLKRVRTIEIMAAQRKSIVL